MGEGEGEDKSKTKCIQGREIKMLNVTQATNTYLNGSAN
jgi:hypothetical protein